MKDTESPKPPLLPWRGWYLLLVVSLIGSIALIWWLTYRYAK